MSVLTREELLNSIKNVIGESTDDEALKFLEDVTDTLNDYESKNQEDWKSKYEENDKAWREKYKSRFFDSSVEEIKENEIKDNVITDYEDLFKEDK